MMHEPTYPRGDWDMECLRLLAQGEFVVLVVEKLQDLSRAPQSLADQIGPAAAQSRGGLTINGVQVLTCAFGDRWWVRFKDMRGKIVLHRDIYRGGKMFDGLMAASRAMKPFDIPATLAVEVIPAYDRAQVLFNGRASTIAAAKFNEDRAKAQGGAA
jgi:hypothetical protein